MHAGMPGQFSWINDRQQVYFSSKRAECMQDAWRFKCQSFLTGEKQQEVRIQCHLPQSASLARQGSSALTFPKSVPQS